MKLSSVSGPPRRYRARLAALLLSGALPLAAHPAHADLFGTGQDSFTIDFVTITHAGNPPDANPNPAGAVPYAYRIGKYEIPEHAIDLANTLGNLGITKDTRGPDFPATSITWFEAARFANWLNEDSGSPPAYKFNSSGVFELWLPEDPGYDPANLYRNKLARYFLPSLNEWHKAAYYDPQAGVYYDYPTGSDDVPDGIDFEGDLVFDAVFFDGALNNGPNVITNVGLPSPFGTMAQGGNVQEWQETAFDRTNGGAQEQRRDDGGSWQSASHVLSAPHTGGGITPNFQGEFLGFRVARVIPEPASLAMLGIGVLSAALCVMRLSMMLRRSLLPILALSTLAVAVDPATAAVMSRDWKSPADGLLTYDDVNQREWLDLTESRLAMFAGTTFEQRYQNALLELQPGEMFEGFTAAKSEDLIALGQSAGINTGSFDFTANSSPANALIELVSPSLFGAVGGVVSFGLLDEIGKSPLPIRLIGELFVNPHSGPTGLAGLFIAPGAGDTLPRVDNTGIWLYRVVPEPRGILSGGILSLSSIWMRRGLQVDGRTPDGFG